MRQTYYLTTPIYYVNGPPHLGHLYTTIVGDAIRRFRAQRGDDAFLLTGTDEHGRNIERAADAAKLPPAQYVDGNTRKFQKMLEDWSLQPSRFIRTTHPGHKAGALHLFKVLKERGHIYKGFYDGWYCVGCNQYYTETEAAAGVCPLHNQPFERVKEESYFFRLSAFGEPLLRHYREHPEFIRPEARLNEVVAFVSAGLSDLSVSRTTVKWGIPIPGDEGHTVYVWLDALSNYVTALGYGNDQFDGLDRYWPADLHLVGKDILRFHTVYWPAFLMGAGLPVPKQVFAHGMWVSGGRKMSKTLGNVIDIEALRRHFPLDATRYFVLREMAFGDDADFNFPAYLRRFNGDLATGLGNLASRTLTLVKTSLDGRVPAAAQDDRAQAVRSAAQQASREVIAAFEKLEFNVGLQAAWRLISEADGYLTATKPWALAKEPSRRAELQTVLGNAAEALRFLAVLLYPSLPTSMLQLWGQLGLSGTPAQVDPAQLSFGGEGERPLGEVKALFQRYDEEKMLKTLEAEGEYKPNEGAQPSAPAPKAAAGPAPAAEGVVTIDQFMAVELKVGVVRSAEKIQGADKLLKLQIDLGEPEPRQVLAGIAQYYSPESLTGRRVVVVANLAPRKMRGLESRGMVLAASVGEDGRPFLVSVPDDVPPGARVR